MAKKDSNFISARESRRISKENARIIKKLDKRLDRRHVPEEEYLTQMRDSNNVVEFDDLHTYFFTDVGIVKAVDGVSFNVPVGKTVGIVGESGCGKSVTSLSLMQLLQRPTGQVVSGEMRLNLGEKAYDVAKMPISAMQHIRGNVVSMIFQVRQCAQGRLRRQLEVRRPRHAEIRGSHLAFRYPELHHHLLTGHHLPSAGHSGGPPSVQRI